MASFFQWLDGMVVKFDPYGTLMINCDNHIFIFSIFSAAVSKLFIFDIWLKSLFKLIFVYFIISYISVILWLDYHYGIQ